MNLPFLYRMLVYKLGYKIDSGLMKMVGRGRKLRTRRENLKRVPDKRRMR